MILTHKHRYANTFLLVLVATHNYFSTENWPYSCIWTPRLSKPIPCLPCGSDNRGSTVSYWLHWWSGAFSVISHLILAWIWWNKKPNSLKYIFFLMICMINCVNVLTFFNLKKKTKCRGKCILNELAIKNIKNFNENFQFWKNLSTFLKDHTGFTL